MRILHNLAKVTQQTDVGLGAQLMESGLEACDLNHKASGSQTMAGDQHHHYLET